MANAKICSVGECGKTASRRGMCNRHYRRLMKHGDPHKRLIEVSERGEPLAFLEGLIGHEGDECIPWPYAKYPNGYGTLHYEGKQQPANRVMCKLKHGSPPAPGHQSAHSCGKGHEGCINPNHLKWKTAVENAADKIGHGTDPSGERNGMAILTIEQVRYIKRMKGRKTAIRMSKEFGVSAAAIDAILAGKNWKWV